MRFERVKRLIAISQDLCQTDEVTQNQLELSTDGLKSKILGSSIWGAYTTSEGTEVSGALCRQ
jgi:hypothetical protein